MTSFRADQHHGADTVGSQRRHFERTRSADGTADHEQRAAARKVQDRPSPLRHGVSERIEIGRERVLG